MRFLRMLSNAFIAGALGAAYLTVLLLQLNPQVALASRSAWHWYLTIGLLYGVCLALAFYGLMLVRAFLTVELFSPAWISVRLLAWLSSAAAAVAAALMWLNLRGLAAALTEESARRFAAGASATTAAAVVLCGIAVAHYSFGRRGSRVGAALLVIALTASLALPVAARGNAGRAFDWTTTAASTTPPASVESSARVTMILLDGASLDYIWPRAAEGRLPNFGRLLDGGASMDLATIRPTQPDPVWAAVATGMYPAKNGVRSAASYFALRDDRPIDLLPDYCFSHALVQLGIVRDERKASNAWRARPLWDVLNDYSISTGIVRWPLTYPAPPLNGFVIADRYHQLIGSVSEVDGRAAYPTELQYSTRDAFRGSDVASAILPGGSPLPESVGPDLTAARWDQYYARAFRMAVRTRPAQFTAIRYQGLDTIGHLLLRYAQPQSYGSDITDEERERYGGVLDRYYGYIDGEIGTAIDALAPGDLLLVVSGFGMQPVGPVARMVNRLLRQPDWSGAHDRAPDGFLLAYGSAVERGKRQRGSIVDIAPTVLYFMGVPIGRDMDGFTRADLFTRQFTAERPITFIPTHNR
ncbi:MAG TPA: alkaline phosphatase family protein [Vicinamibacterales bacterium]|nr:alkaline phosphatase family protein [Vicinamibacterales bacterium]